MRKNIEFQMEDVVEIPQWTEAYPEHKFAVYKCCFLSTKPNAHKLDIDDGVLREYAATILGNFLVAKVQFGDAMSHEKDEIIYGYFPREQGVEFVEDGDITKAYAYAVVSKRYSKEFNGIFEFDNLRNSSVEMTVETEDNDDGKVLSFDIFGLTCLGKRINGSCPDADIELVRFSESDAEGYYKKIHGQLDFKHDGKEEKMEDKNIEMAEVEQTEVVEEPTVEMAEPEKQDEEMACDEKLEEEKPDGDKPDDDDEDKDEKMSEDEMMAKIDQLTKDVEDRDHIIMEKDAELAELRKFKEVAMAKETACAVEAVMAEVRPFVSDEQFAAFRDEGLACTDGNLDAWSNKVKAACFSEVKKVVKKDEAGVLTFAMPKESKMNKQSEDIWTRLKNQH